MCFWEIIYFLTLTLKVIKIAEQNVYFAMLPPNAMQLLQLLDVCVFSLMNESWRDILQEWKKEI